MNLVIYNTKNKQYLNYIDNPCRFTKDPMCAFMLRSKKIANKFLMRARKFHPKMDLQIKQLISFPFSPELTKAQLDVDIATAHELITTVRKVFNI